MLDGADATLINGADLSRERVKVPKVKPGRGGRVAVRITVPAGAQAVLYRARTMVPSRAGRPATKGTFTLPRAADVG